LLHFSAINAVKLGSTAGAARSILVK